MTVAVTDVRGNPDGTVTEDYQDRMGRERQRQERLLRQLVDQQRSEPMTAPAKPRTRREKRRLRERRDNR